MDVEVEPPNDSEELIKLLGDRIEDLERILIDDEDFCNKDIDATYQAALKYTKSLEERCHEKLNELKTKLDQIRGENLNVSKQNKKQFDDEIDDINLLFSSGKHQEALEKFQDYEKRFQQRVTIIQNIPKLYMKDIDINQYLSFDKPIDIPVTPLNDTKQDSFENIKQTIKTDFFKKEDKDLNEQEYNKSSFDVRFKRSDSQQILTNNNSINKETKSPVSNSSQRPLRFSTRLASSPNSKSLPIGESDLATPPSVQNNHPSPRGNMPNYTQTRSTPSSPNVIPSLIPKLMATAKIGRGEGLTPIYVGHYQHVQATSLLMTCTKDYIILFRSQSDRLIRWNLSAIQRSDRVEYDLNWRDPLIISIGSINKNHIYMFTEHEFIIYSLNSFSQVKSWTLNSDQANLECRDIKRGIGIVHDNYIYHLSINNKFHQILSQYELETMNHLGDYNLTEIFPDVKRFIHICINDKTIGFLVEMDGLQYAVIFCSKKNCLTSESRRLIQLSYAGNPLTICSVYMHYLQKYIFFINDPSAKIIHILTNEKYLQSYSITPYTLCYIEENHELIFTSNDGIYSIKLNEHESFFSKFH